MEEGRGWDVGERGCHGGEEVERKREEVRES